MLSRSVLRKIAAALQIFTPVLCGILMLVISSSRGLAQTYTFDTGTEGWGVYNISIGGGHLVNLVPISSAPAFDASNGLPAGSLRVSDLVGETWIGAPAAATGNHAAFYGSEISFDIFYRTADAATYPAIALAGVNITLYVPMPAPTLETWLHWSFPLVPGTWHVNTPDGPAATEAQIRDVLSNVRGLYIHTEWKTGPDDTNVDNIRFGCLQIGPASGLVCPTGAIPFTAFASGPGPLGYQWQIQVFPGAGGWQDLTPVFAPLPCGGSAAAATPTTSSTTISIRPCPGSVLASQRFAVRCVVTNTCIGTASSEATYTTCPADFNCSGSLNVQDIFDFLTAWFAGDPRADFNALGGISVQDIFDFLGSWFAGCT